MPNQVVTSAMVEQIRLEHHGVKGMKWGIRKKRNKTDVNNPRHIQNIGVYKKPLYHVSKQKLDNQVLTPRVPDNFLIKNGYENSTTPRVSFTPDVGSSLMALSQNIKGQRFYVYQPSDQKKHTVYRPDVIAVPDSALTSELWIKEPVKLKLVGSILVGEAFEKPLTYKYGEHVAEIYKWAYQEV